MEDNTIFNQRLEVALSKKTEWYNSTDLLELVEAYRLIYTCVKNINEFLVKKDVINPDPYKLDRRISDIAPLDASPFQDQEASNVLGTRFSEYEMMLDFICTYFRFSIENLSSSKIKTLLDINKTFDWNNLSPNNTHCNTRALAVAIGHAKINSPAVLISTLGDNLEKCKKNVLYISKKLVEINDFNKELYKGRIRKEVIEHPDFDKTNAYSSPEAEAAEIKRLYSKVTGKKALSSDAVTEIVNEDQGVNAIVLRDKLLAKLGIQQKEVERTTKGPDPKFMLMQTVLLFGAISPIIDAMFTKIKDNFDLLFADKKGFGAKLKKLFKNIFGIKDKPKVCSIPVTDTKTGNKSIVKIQVQDFLEDLSKKSKIYNGLGIKGPEYAKIESAEETAILSFINKQISENQTLFTTINSLDEYFKSNVEILLRPKVKGLKIDLSSYRNAIIAVNKKRGEYLSYKEEQEQYQKLGITK